LGVVGTGSPLKMLKLKEFRHPSKALYTFLEDYPFSGIFSQKIVKYFWGHMKDGPFFCNFKVRLETYL